MQLDVARLCLDCEEVHDQQVCPACGSEVFAYLTRWVQPASEGRAERPADTAPAARTKPAQAQTARPSTPEQLEAYRQLLEGKPARGRGSLLTKGMLGLAAFGLAGWAWRATGRPRPPKPGNDSEQ